MRILGWIFLAMALVAVALDVASWAGGLGVEPEPFSGAFWSALWAESGAFEFRVLGLTWADIHRSSLQTLQPAIERHVHPDLYAATIRPLLLTPAAPMLAGVGIAFLLLRRLLGQRRTVRL